MVTKLTSEGPDARASSPSPRSAVSPDPAWWPPPCGAGSELPRLYQLAGCSHPFPGLSFHQQKCGKTSSVVNCCTSLHAHGADLLLLLLTHSLGALQPPASALAFAQLVQVLCQASALLAFALRLPSPFPWLPELLFLCWLLLPWATRWVGLQVQKVQAAALLALPCPAWRGSIQR